MYNEGKSVLNLMDDDFGVAQGPQRKYVFTHYYCALLLLVCVVIIHIFLKSELSPMTGRVVCGTISDWIRA